MKNINLCSDCHKPISSGSTFCKTCSQKGPRNHQYRKHAWNYQGSYNYCCMDCGGLISAPTALTGLGRCKSCSRKGPLNWVKKGIYIKEKNKNWKGGKPKCKDCGKELSAYHCIRCKSCRNKYYVLRGIEHPMYGKSASWKRIKYKELLLKSSWEYLVCFWLDLNKIQFNYEPQAFPVKIHRVQRTYTPDFYLPEFDCWIEVKGWWREDGKEKIKCFRKQYPQINLKIWRRKQICKFLNVSYRELDSAYKNLIKGV